MAHSVHRFLLVVAASLLLTGCGTKIDGTPVAPSGYGGARIPDREQTAVVAAMRELDACALLDDPKAQPQGPHGCEASSASGRLRLRLGYKLSHTTRWAAQPVDAAGMHGYIEETGSGTRQACSGYLPVSFGRSIFVAADGNGACDQVKAKLVAVAGKLANPDAVKVNPATRPLAQWDGCSALGVALGDELTKYTLSDLDAVTVDATDGCEARLKGSKVTSQDSLRYNVKYSSPAAASVPLQDIAGKKAFVSNRAGSCSALIDNGPSGVENKVVSVVEISVTAKTCEAMTALAGKIVTTLQGSPPSLGNPQRPVLIPANQPDEDAPGACVDYRGTGCTPYDGKAKLPGDKKEALAAANADTRAVCALAEKQVKQAFGDTMRPVIYGDFCVFVEPTHVIEVNVSISDKYPPAEYGKDPKLYKDIKSPVTFGGAQAKSFRSGKDNDTYTIYLSQQGDIAQRGMIGLEARVKAPRGSAFDAKPDPARQAPLDKLAEEIAKAYL
ncbi:hypothetical protein D5S17_15440 [Pseudonocardiaceae bacterium YIM PH 21723]|nr:hypothetical protein D5S17_15440 [Pseudonocardiaceae bacterium YIM PH 21723]